MQCEDAVSNCDLSSCGSVVDIGGGEGLLLARILQAHPKLQGVCLNGIQWRNGRKSTSLQKVSPSEAKEAHRALHSASDRFLEENAVNNLKKWYAKDYDFLTVCRNILSGE
jgi:hypothetical protein